MRRHTITYQQACIILGVAENSSIGDIKIAYRDLAQVWHPDRFATANDRIKSKSLVKMKEINEAYEVICNHLSSQKQEAYAEPTAKPTEYNLIQCVNCGANNRAIKGVDINTVICGKCGAKVYYYQPPKNNNNSCGDGCCKGILDDSGRCTVCRKTYEEGKEEHNIRTSQNTYAGINLLNIAPGRGHLAVILIIFVIVFAVWGKDNNSGSANINSTSNGNKDEVPETLNQRKEPVPLASGRSHEGNSKKLQSEKVEISPPNDYLPPLNGENIIEPDDTSGRGMLTIENGNSLDAAVKLVYANDTGNATGIISRFVYVRQNSSYIITGIPEGNYRIKFNIGKKWNSEGSRFYNGSSSIFRDIIEYKEERVGNSIYYSNNSITLNPVVNGKAKTYKINEDEF